jgi:hypothetical protein
VAEEELDDVAYNMLGTVATEFMVHMARMDDLTTIRGGRLYSKVNPDGSVIWVSPNMPTDGITFITEPSNPGMYMADIDGEDHGYVAFIIRAKIRTQSQELHAL